MQVKNKVVKSKALVKKPEEKPSLRIISVDFVPTPSAEHRLAKVYDLLLKPMCSEKGKR